MKRYDLSKHKWNLIGWAEYEWLTKNSGSRPEIDPVPARVPGSVQNALLQAGLIPDWNVGLNSYACEWVENRHWEYVTRIPANWIRGDESVRLVCQGLDHKGTILIDGKPVVDFEGTLIPHVFDLTGSMTPHTDHELSIVFRGIPDEQGQFGYTSRSHHFKPRFVYKWDWCPRIVPIGPWEGVTLEVGNSPRFMNVRPQTHLKSDLKTGRISFLCKVWSQFAKQIVVHGRISLENKTVVEVRKKVRVKPGEQTVVLDLPSLPVSPWYPNGWGESRLYQTEVVLIDQNDQMLDRWSGRTGFKQIRWLPCEGAPVDALPWLCEVNGKKIFLQGANWVPIRPNYHDLKRSDYVKRIKLYKRLGFNLLRVWGGGILERQDFYELCDEHGIMVWQEFPQSSSGGGDSSPPRNPESIDRLTSIARSYIDRRGGHVCRLLWCGGNELVKNGPEDISQVVAPQDENHPCLKALGEVVREMDPDIRFLPTSPYGPEFCAAVENFGKGIHHNIHGPWKLEGTFEEWIDYWNKEDALLRAETGAPGASPLDIIEEFKGDCQLWPPSIDNPYWRHRGAWWTEWERFKSHFTGKGGQRALKRYVELSQDLQARALAHVARVRKSKFPATAGLIIWMGHDTFPCTANTSIINYWGRPKPAALALAKIFKQPIPSLKDK